WGRAINFEVLADRSAVRPIKVNRSAPFILITAREIVLRKLAQIISIWAKMVVHHIQNDPHAELMRLVHKLFELRRRAIEPGRSVQVYPIVPPAEAPCEIGHWQQ